jgi:PAS domain S-box-containing protein
LGRITAFSPAAESLYGIARDQAIGLPLSELIEQLAPDGSPLTEPGLARPGAGAHWHGRLIHRPRIGSLAGHQIRVDVTLTSATQPTGCDDGLVATVRAARPEDHDASDSADLGSVATPAARARSDLSSTQPEWPRPAGSDILASAGPDAVRLPTGPTAEQRLLGQLDTLMGLTLLPQGHVSEEMMSCVLLERVVSALGADSGLAVRESAGRLKVIAAQPMASPMVELVETTPALDIPVWAQLKASRSTRAIMRQTVDSAAIFPNAGPDDERGQVSWAAFPIREGDRLTGAFLAFFNSPARTAEVDQSNIEAVGRIISIAYANARMSEGLAEAAKRESRLTATLRTLQELTLLGASSEDLSRLASKTIDLVMAACGALGGGYVLVDALADQVDPIIWVGRASHRWATFDEVTRIPGDWPSLAQLKTAEEVWISCGDDRARPGDNDVQAVLPLRVDGRLEGLLHLEWGNSADCNLADGHVLGPIARICSISLANFRLRAELLSRAGAQRALGRRLATLDDLTRIGEEATSFEELARRTVTLVREALDADAVCYLLVQPGRRFETQATAGDSGAFRKWLAGVPAGEVPAGRTLLSGGGSELGEFLEGHVSARALTLAAASGFRSYGAIPIRAGDELAGVLLCFFTRPAAALPLLNANALDSVSRITGIALANFHLRERLVSSEDRYRTLFEESPDALLVTALDGTVLDVNDAAVALYRGERVEMLGRYVGLFMAADERELARRRQIVWAEGRGTFRDRSRRADGSEFAVEVEIRVVELDRQRRFLQLIRDLSDQEHLQRELLQAQKMEAIGQLVSGVAHELNNPLAAIVIAGQVINTDPRLPDDMKHMAGLLMQETDRTRRIVQGLLDFARARPPERRPTSVAALVQSVLELQSYALDTNRIQVELDIPDSLPHVDLDRAQLQQVLLNLTINAIQAIRSCDRKTAAHLHVSAAPAKPPARRATKADRAKDEPRVRITVTDDGPGVPEPARARLFDPFFTTKQPGEGTGLGLSVSFGIVAAHDGQLWYEPGPGGVGSSFIIEMPVRARGPEPGRAADPAAWDSRPTSPIVPVPAPDIDDSVVTVDESAPERNGPDPAIDEPGPVQHGSTVAPAGPASVPARPQVLALDDEPSIRKLLCAALDRAGIDCVAYEKGPDALAGLRASDFNVMLVDHRLKDMMGTEFYEAAIKTRPEVASRAVFMSGDVLNPELVEFARARGIRLLAKPFDIDTVIRVVRETLAASAANGGEG